MRGRDALVWDFMKKIRFAVIAFVFLSLYVVGLLRPGGLFEADFIVYGQTNSTGAAATGARGAAGGTTATSGTTGTTSPRAGATSPISSVTSIIPQVAAGRFEGSMSISTSIAITNPGPSPASAFSEIFGAMRLRIQTSDGVTIDNALVQIPPGATIMILPEARNESASGWVRVTSSGLVFIRTTYETRHSSTGALVSRVSEPAASGTAAALMIPRTRRVETGLDTAVALVNTSTTGISVTARLADRRGNQIASRVLSLDPHEQLSQFIREIFTSAPEPAGEAHQVVFFEAGTSVLAATAMAYEGQVQSSVPVFRIR